MKYFLDARTLPCPQPVAKAKLLLKQMKIGDVLTVWCKDEITLLDFKGFCGAKNYTLFDIMHHDHFIEMKISMMIDPVDSYALTAIVERLQEGELVAIPTETVYGIAADAANPHAIEKIYQLKGRPSNRPLSVLLEDKNHMPLWSAAIPDMAWKLAEKFWPGPLTLVLPKAPHVLSSITASLETIALRVPAHPVTLAILKAFGSGLAAPSANPFNQRPALTAAEVVAYFPENLWIVDGGCAEIGLASTIVDCTGTEPCILRAGMITEQEIIEIAMSGIY